MQSQALFLGGLGACPRKSFKIRYFENESICKIHTVTFTSHDHVIKPTTLNIKQLKSWWGGGEEGQ